ncbi:hypothetical protein AB0I28_38825 [Phytomonospora sp. NPDC050363]|uniref:hypothetical protein n=1 Tax=Phytomonospora sp. NPDC050363 TaxID=3155642 RepID=UPI003408697B
MRHDGEPVIDLDLSVEGLTADDETAEPGEDVPRSRRALLLDRLRRPWPRPLIVALTAVVSIGGMAAIQRPEPDPEPVPPVAAPTPAPEYLYVAPGPDGLDPVDEEYLIDGSGEWHVTVENPFAEMLGETSGKLGTPDGEVLDQATGFGDLPHGSNELPPGNYILEYACSATVDFVTMRHRLSTMDGVELATGDLPCDGPAAELAFTLEEAAVLRFQALGPNSVYIGYSFRVTSAKR